MNKTIRWKQRFENFQKAYLFFESACKKNSYSELERGGVIKSFEFTFELSWKTLKDYLESQGIEEKFPRTIIKTAFQNDIIKDGHTWMEMLDKRNELSHTYDEATSIKAVELITKNYYPEIKQVYIFLHLLVKDGSQ